MHLILFLLAACQPTTTYNELKVVQMGRESTETDESLIKILAKDGWRYEGPLYNNGLNCTASLWVR